MYIQIPCSVCSNNLIRQVRSKSMTPCRQHTRLFFVQDSSLYEFECPEGHQSVAVLQTPRHEVLAMIASNAILDGYFRESIASFAASLERFYEFVIRVVCRSKLIQKDNINNFWKLISKQSERQFGSFAMLWTLEMGTPPKTLSTKMIELRNKVIHQGKVPTREECIGYGQEVLDIISGLEQEVRQRFPVHHKEELRAVCASVKSIHGDKEIIRLNIDSPLRQVINEKISLEESLNRLNEGREIYNLPLAKSEYIRTEIIYPSI